MNEIKPVERFTFSVDHEIAHQDELGIWVKFSDYEALQKENEEMKRHHKLTCENLLNTVPFIQELEQKNAAQAKRIAEALASKQEPVQFLYDMTPPPEFLEYIRKNYSGEVNFHDPDWHAMRLWNSAMKNFKPPYIDFPFKDKAKQEHIESNQDEPNIPENMQDWKGMDGAIAWHLIGRHAENWVDTGKMMDEWLASNQPKAIEPVKPLPTFEQFRKQCADACEKATPDRSMIRVIGEAAHYVACKNAVLSVPLPAQDNEGSITVDIKNINGGCLVVSNGLITE